MSRFLSRLCPCVFLVVLLPQARADLPPLIPRQVLFGGALKTGLELSPDGLRLGYVAASDKGVLNVWVQTLGKEDARMVTQDTRRGIFGFNWAADGKHILYRQDLNGDENWHIYAADLDSRLVRDLTPFVGVRAQDMLVSSKRPQEILVGLNIRDRRVFDMHRIDLISGAVTLEAQNPGDVLSWTTDEDFIIRACTAFGGDDAHTTIRVRASAADTWRDLLSIPFEDCCFYGQVNGGTLVAGFAPGGKSLYVVNPLGGDKTRLVELDLQTGKELREIAADPRCDVEYQLGVLFHPAVVDDPASGRIQAVGFNFTRLEWKVTDPAVAADFAALQHAHEGTLQIVNRVKDDSLWLVVYTRPDAPAVYYLYDRSQKKTTPLLTDQPELARYKLAAMESVVVRSRDGLDLVCYLTVPPGVERKNLPLILFPHGGPWWRDRWGYDAWAQLAANRGYAVLQPQYRGSTGFGKKFLNASNRQFGDQAIMNDYLDVVQWAVDSGLADRDRLGVMGASGGGYASLCCIAFHPELWKCAVDMVGPSSVRTLLHSIPAYWKPVKQRWVLRFGDAEHDDAWNEKISPLYHVDKIRAPLLIGHGLNDPRVSIDQAEQMARALRERKRPVTLIVYPDEGHGFARPENNLDFFGRMEEFLAKHLGGRKQPWQPLPGSTAQER
ncbi:MAG TPA: S9 family peptidase [Gemmataceae bacterium]|jgi:acetyl esterase/lipase|nr:S9 family peptidase [Gemmataceae bacterium]